MGCTSSISRRCAMGRRRRRSTVPMVAIFVPSLRVPAAVDLVRPLRGFVSRDVVERLSGLRSRIVLLAEQDIISVVSELQRALEEYVPVLLGLTSKENQLDGLVEFRWKNLENDGQETRLASAWYELLSVMHMRAMLSLLEANMKLVPKESSDDSEVSVSEDSKKAAVDLLLKASGYLNYCINHILVRCPLQIRQDLPHDLQDGVLEATCIQALGQASAYYYHGLLLNKGPEPSNHVSAACCHLASDELLLDSKRACLSFCLAAPVTRVPPVWGVMKHLHKKIPDMASRKAQMYAYLLDEEREFQTLPEIPEFSLSLKPEDFELPDIDASWDGGNWQPEIQSLKEHLMDED